MNILEKRSGAINPKTAGLLCVICIVFFIAASVQADISQSAASPNAALPEQNESAVKKLTASIHDLAAFGDRSTGTDGCGKAAQYIRSAFKTIGLENIAAHRFGIPLLRHGGSTLSFLKDETTFPINPVQGSAVTPETIPPEGIEGPLYYVGAGELSGFNGKPVKNAVILMDLDSGRNWLHAASMGAKALIYVEKEKASRIFYEDKLELSPIQFPRFRMSYEDARRIFGDFEKAENGLAASRIRLNSKMQWQLSEAENIYGLIPGADPELAEELVLVEAFYDSTAQVFGSSPGADESVSIATLLELGRYLKKHPPARSVMLVATAGHAQTLYGMRELIWSIRSRSKDIRKEQKRLKASRKECKEALKILESALQKLPENENDGRKLQEIIDDSLKTEVDIISRKLMSLRMEEKTPESRLEIKAYARQRLLIRRLGWCSDYSLLDPQEQQLLRSIIPRAMTNFQAMLSDAGSQLKHLKSAKLFRSAVKAFELTAAVSLHLSSHGDGVGAFNYGWLYPIKARINRVGAYSSINDALNSAGSAADDMVPLRDTLRPSPKRPWQSYFADRPYLGGEVSALAGYLGFTLATVNDARRFWGTPHDLPETVDMQYAMRQSRRINALIDSLSRTPEIYTGSTVRNGFATVTGRAKRLRHGELFADQAAGGVTVLAYQGQGHYYAMTDASGRFQLKGVATKKLVLDKVIIEGYRFDPETGEAVWAIDKKGTGKAAYRVKMQRHRMETGLIMFTAKQTCIFNLLEPRNFRYMTKIQLLDGQREALPLRYWYSRIDTRSSTISSIFLEPGTYLKLTHSDTVLQKKMVLLNATKEDPQGTGYRIDDWPIIPNTDFHVAKDMWTLLTPRIENLESHGIFDERIQKLQQEGKKAVQQAETALASEEYDRFSEESMKAWALASRVYSHVEKVQKDVLFGVLFYIALFVPFAFCMERLLFSFRNIHKRIIAFLAILLLLIAVIHRVHPAFQLAYSPTVVILAFFIMGLSLMVTLIIFFRFEEEMILLQRKAGQMRAEEISRWKAFTAAFFLGVSNLRRRRMRTILTCTTLIILTFTIMSFTSVKSTRRHARLQISPDAPYLGFLLKNINWLDLPSDALGILANTFEGEAVVAPRVWLEDEDETSAVPIPVRLNGKQFEARGMAGLSYQEPQATGLDKILTGGRWFNRDERESILLPVRIAEELGIDPQSPQGETVTVWGIPLRVAGVFSGEALQQRADLDGEPLTPVIFPSEVSSEMTEAEMEAMESGEDVQAFQSRYQHIDPRLTVIVPAKMLSARGGKLKGIAIRPSDPSTIPDTARFLSDRFGLPLFSGELQGVYMYQGSDALNYSGVPNILIPLIISILIVLNTMIGSVYERKREIGVYTSVGLAPSHVSFLFIAEALAFAVLSVVLGYLLAQVSASLFAGTALWSGITVNYSSLAGVASMILVILVVLASVIYPSKVAADIAIPDVNRSWSLPDVHDNMIDVTLPFLVKPHEHDSIAGFLFSYFEGCQDVSQGIFSTGQIDAAPTNLTANGAPMSMTCLMLRAKVWLAPFDFGIMQQIMIHFCPSRDNRDYLEIDVRLKRESGEANAWKRINKSFLNDLRKQLLVWRSLGDEARREYEKRVHPKTAKAGII